MKLIDADLLYYEDIECTDGYTYMVVHSPQIDNADEFDLIQHDKQVRADAIDEFANKMKKLISKWFYSGVINLADIDINKIAEQLKENKNV